MQNRLQQQIHFLYEIDKVKDIFRQSLVVNGKREENDAEHSWHMAMTAITLQEYFLEPVNMEKVLKMILIHDIIEIYAGDTPAFSEIRDDKFEAEFESAKKVFGILPVKESEELLNLWLEFEAMETSEAKFATVCDRLQGFIQNLTSDGHTWKKFNVSIDKVLKGAEPIKLYTPKLFYDFVMPEFEEYMKKGIIKP